MIKAIVNDFAENCYIISEGKDAYVIDPGSNYEAMIAYLKEHDLSIVGVLLTHGHYDHICGLNKLLHDTDAPIYIHESERDFLFDPTLNLSSFMADRFRVAEKHRIETINEDSTFTLGSKTITVVHTPGHTRGSVSYIIDDVIFSGDTLFRETVGRTDLPTGDHAQLEQSVHRLLKGYNDNTIVYPGHGPFTTIVHEKQNNMVAKSAF